MKTIYFVPFFCSQRTPSANAIVCIKIELLDRQTLEVSNKMDTDWSN